MLQDPRWVRREAKRGFSTPTYAYAGNNPLAYVDRDGRFRAPAWVQVVIFGTEVLLGGAGVISAFPPPGSASGTATHPSYLPPLPGASAGTGTGTGASTGARALSCATSGPPPKSCDEHYDACMDAHEANGWPTVYNCVECTRQCRMSGGQWPTIKESSGDRYLCDYENPWTTPSGE